MKHLRRIFLILFTLSIALAAFGEPTRTVGPYVQSQWHQTAPWNARCPGQGQTRAHAGSHALALSKLMKYWQYPTYGTGSVSYVDDDFGPLTQNFSADINWGGMSNTLVFQTTQRFIYMCGVAAYTDYEYTYSTSSLTNVRNALINHFTYDVSMQIRPRQQYTNFVWKSIIRTELDAQRPVVYTVTLTNGNEVAFLIDGYHDDGTFHANFSNENFPDAWIDLNSMNILGELVPEANQQMLTGIQPSFGPDTISENFEEGFSNFNWQFSGNSNWTISSEAAFYGSHSAKSGNIDHNQITSMFIQINVTQADTISFFKKVSCESEPNSLYDHLAFFINNVEQERWSGDGSWAYHEYPVSPGLNTFRWTYTKDGASVYFSDCAWVDAITFPEGTTPLNAPRFVESQVIADNDISLDWMVPEGVLTNLLGYKVYRNGVEIAQFSNPSMINYTDFNLPNGSYTYYLRAVYTTGISNPSNSTTTSIEIPYAPTNLVATAVNMNTVLLSWTAPPLIRNRALMGYNLYRDNVLHAQIENPEALNYQDQNMQPGVYYYQISAVWEAGESALSNTAQIALGVPEPPPNFQVTVAGSTANLSWGMVADPTLLTGYKIFRNGVAIITLNNPSLRSYSDANLHNGGYSYYIRALYGTVESGNSPTRSIWIEVPYAPINLTANVTQDDVMLSWTNPETVRALTHYFIYRNNQLIAGVFNPAITVYTDLNLPNGTYSYKVTAVYSGVESPASNTISATVEVLYPPRNLTATSTSLGTANLSWQIPVTSGGLPRALLGYSIYRDNVLITSITPGTNTTYTNTNVPSGAFLYEVAANYSTGTSSRVGITVNVQGPDPVTQISYSVDDNDITISWEEVDNPFLQTYRLYRGTQQIYQGTALSYTDQNLANGTWSYYVVAVYPGMVSTPSPTVTITLDLAYPPTSLTASVTGDDVQLNWQFPVTNGGLTRSLNYFRVYRNGTIISNADTNSFLDSNLPNGTYQYMVDAMYNSGASTPTGIVTAIVEVKYPPQNLSGVALDATVTLAWEAPANQSRSLLGYKVYRNSSLLGNTTALTFYDEGMMNGQYTYAVSALYTSGESPLSNTYSTYISVPITNTIVTGIVTGDDVTLHWAAIVPPMGITLVGYRIFRNGEQLTQVPSGDTYIDSNLANGTYQYTIRVVYSTGLSQYSNTYTANVEVLYPPTALQYQVNENSVSLSWNAAPTSARAFIGYKIYRDNVEIGQSTTTSYTDAGLMNGTYQYYVKAAYSTGLSAPTNTISATVLVLYSATGLTANVNGDDVSLAWTAPLGRAFTGYRVMRNNVEIGFVTTTGYSDENLANGTYRYQIITAYTEGDSNPSNTATAIVEVLYPPTALTYTVDMDTVNLGWNAAATSARNLLRYNIYRDGNIIGTSTVPSFSNHNLANGSYQYYITALYDSGESVATNTITATVEVLYTARNLSYTVVQDDVQLNWLAANTSGRNFITYKIYRDGTEIAETNTLDYLDSDLTNGSYSYYVTALYDSGESTPSNTVTALVEVLYPPTAFALQVFGDDVSLSWNAAAISGGLRGFVGYKIYRDGNLLATTPDLNYTDANLPNGIYNYYLTALYDTGESTPTETLQATVEILYPPTTLTYQVDDDAIVLSWTAAVNSARVLIGYNVYRNGSLLTQLAETTYTDDNLANGNYSYYVTALYSSGESTPTNTVSHYLEVLYPATALLASVNGDDVSLSWTVAAVSGGLRNFIGYKVLRDGTQIALAQVNSYSDNNLANGIYSYTVVASYTSGDATPTDAAIAIVEVLYSPSNLSYSVNADAVTLSWNAAPISARAFITYNIYRDAVQIAQSTALTYTDTGLTNGGYQYYVTALYDSGESTPTNTVSPYIEVLYPPTLLSYTVNQDAVSLSWNAAAISGGLRAFTGYNVYRDGLLLTNTMATSFTDPNLTNGSYQYYITALYDSGESTPSNTVTALVEVLYPPTAFALQVFGDDVSLSWNAAAISGGLRSFICYKIYKDGNLLATTPDLTYTDANLPNGIYNYYLTALYDTGESTPTETLQATVEVLYPPTTLTYQVDDDAIVLSWTAAVNSARVLIGYNVYRTGSLLTQLAETTYTDDNLANGNYSYYVTALYSSGESTPTNTVSHYLEVLYPATALLASVTNDDVSLSWTPAAVSGGLRNFIGYKVLRDGTQIAMAQGNSYIDNNLANGIYSYTVVASYTSGDATPTDAAIAIVEVLYSPSNLSYSVNADAVTLSWNAAPISARAFITYNIYRDAVQIAQSTELSYTDTGLTNGGYQYYVTALYDSGESTPTNTVSPYIEVLYPPTLLSYTVNQDAVSLSWNAAAISGGLRAFIGYNIYRNGALLTNTMATSFNDLGLTNGSYSYYVTALYNSGESIPTNTITALVEVLYPPTALSYSVVGDDVSLSWNASAISGGLRSFIGYKIYRDGILINTIPTVSYTDQNLANGSYSYYVTATYDSGESIPTNTVTAIVEVLYPPTQLTYSVDSDDISLSWIASVNSARNLIGYKVYKNGNFLAQTTALNYNDLNLANGTYSYYVTAIYHSGESSPTNTVTPIVEVTYPASQLSAVVNGDSVQLNWVLPAISTPRAFTGYFIYRNGNLHTVLSNPALTSYTDTSVANGDYSYWVVALYDAGLSIPSNTVNVTVLVLPDLFPPTNLVATIVNTRDVNLTWLAPTGNPTLYRIYRDGVEIATSTIPSYTDLNLPNGSYIYTVRAQYIDGLSSVSGSATADILFTYPPTMLSAINPGGNSILLSWLPPQQGEIGFLIYRNNLEIAYISNPATTTYTDSGLANGSYSYKMASVFSSGISSFSNSAVSSVAVIYAPTALQHTVVANSVNLSWTAVSDGFGLLGYKIYRDGIYIGQSTETSYSNSNLANGTYSYYVTALYVNGESTPTNSIGATIQIAYPANLLNVSVSGDDVTLSWNPPTDLGFLIGYKIFRNGSQIGTATTTNYSDVNLANGSYTYYVLSEYSFGDAAPSNSQAVTIELAYPVNNVTLSVNGNTISVNWNAPANQGGLRALLGYKIYKNGAYLLQTNNLYFNDSNLNNGTYSYQVSALYDSGESTLSAVQSATVMVAYIPTGLSLNMISDNSAQLSWNAVGQSAIGYSIYRNGGIITGLLNPATTVYLDSNLPNGTFAYQIKAHYPGIDSELSAAVLTEIILPYSPSGLSTVVNATSVALTWQAPSDVYGLSGYRIYRNGVAQHYTTQLSWLQTDLNNATHTFYVVAVYGTTESAPSNTASALVEMAYAPTALNITVSGNDAALAWAAPADLGGFDHYTIYQNATEIAQTNQTTYNATDLPNGAYTYSIKAAYTTAGLSSAVTHPSINILVAYPPQNLSANPTQNNITLQWEPPFDPGFLTGYRLYRNGSVIAEPTTLSYTDANLANGEYTYSISAMYGSLESSQISIPAIHIEIMEIPANLQQITSGNNVSLSWDPITDTAFFVNYTLYRNGLSLANITDTQYSDSNLANGAYTYFVQANYQGGSSLPSLSVSTTIILAYPPRNFAASSNGSQVNFTWQAPIDSYGLNQYILMKGTDIAAVIPSAETSYSISVANGNYQYHLIANFGDSLESASDNVSVNVLSAYPVRNFTASVHDTSVTLTWQAPNDALGLSSYRLNRNGTLVYEGTLLSYTDTALANGSYTYSITAIYGSLVSSSISQTVNVALIVAATNVTASQTEAGFVITWNMPEVLSLPNSYQVYFLLDGQQNTPSAWVLVNTVNSIQPVIDANHGGHADGSFLWAVKAIWTGYTGITSFSNVIVIDPLPIYNRLIGNFPNPFNPSTNIKFWLKQESKVKISVYNNRGQLVRTLINTTLPQGDHTVVFDGKSKDGNVLPSGIYFYTMESGKYHRTEKMVLMK